MTTTTPSESITLPNPACGPNRTTSRRLMVNVPTAAGISLVIWAVAQLGDVDLVVRTGGGTTTIGWGSVLLASALATAAGTVTLAFLRRRLRRGRTIGFWLVTVLFLLSLVAGPLAATTPTAGAVLGTMHAVVWGVLTGGFRRRR
jgi:hypothetical protein